MQWLGGLGIIVLFLAVMPSLNRSSNKIMMFSAEMSGIGIKKLHPKMMMTARKLLGIYIIYKLKIFVHLVLPEFRSNNVPGRDPVKISPQG